MGNCNKLIADRLRVLAEEIESGKVTVYEIGHGWDGLGLMPFATEYVKVSFLREETPRTWKP